MSKYRDELPQLSGGLFLTDGGIETDLIFNHGIEIREFAAHTLLPDAGGREAVAHYLRGYLRLANEYDAVAKCFWRLLRCRSASCRGDSEGGESLVLQ